MTWIITQYRLPSGMAKTSSWSQKCHQLVNLAPQFSCMQCDTWVGCKWFEREVRSGVSAMFSLLFAIQGRAFFPKNIAVTWGLLKKCPHHLCPIGVYHFYCKKYLFHYPHSHQRVFLLLSSWEPYSFNVYWSSFMCQTSGKWLYL